MERMCAALLCVVIAAPLCCARAARDGGGARLDFPQPKLWWAKQITPELYTAGRLTERQIKYAGEAGFRALVSMFSIGANRTWGEETVPDRDTEEHIATRLAGMEFGYVLPEGFAWKSSEVTRRLADVLDALPRPVLYHCEASFSASFHAVGYLALRTADDPAFEPRVRTDDWFARATRLGIDYGSDPVLRELAANITGEPEIADPPVPEVSVPDWMMTYWPAKPVHRNWYAAGQIQANHVDNLAGLELDHVINTRLGPLTDGDPTQEEVTLLNVADETGTYLLGGRQSGRRLLDTRLDAARPAEYVDWSSAVNYEASNPLEFGDHVGYNETLLRLMMETELPGVRYHHTPFGKFEVDPTITFEDWEKNKGIWGAIDGDIMVTSRDSTDAMIVALLGAGHQYGLPASWALARAEELGFPFSTTRPDVAGIFKEVLGVRRTSGTRDTGAVGLMMYILLAIVIKFMV